MPIEMTEQMSAGTMNIVNPAAIMRWSGLCSLIFELTTILVQGMEPNTYRSSAPDTGSAA